MVRLLLLAILLVGQTAVASAQSRYAYYVHSYYQKPVGMSPQTARRIIRDCQRRSRRKIRTKPSRNHAVTRRGAWARFRMSRRCITSQGLRLKGFRTGRFNQ